MPKFQNKLLLKAMLCVFLVSFGLFLVKAQDQGIVNLEAEIRSRIAQKQQQARTLQQEISQIDQEVKEAEKKLMVLNDELTITEQTLLTLQNEIKLNEVKLEREKGKLKEGIKLLYEFGEVNPVEVIVSNNSVTGALSKQQYLEAINVQIADSVVVIREIKDELDKKNKELQNKKDEQKSLIDQQLMLQQDLNSRKMAKDALLAQTKGEESAYQQILSKGVKDKEEVAAMLRAISSGASPTALGLSYSGVRAGQRVHRGEMIGLMGNTGFSTGPHLHFGVYQNGQDIDPLPLLSSNFLLVPAPGATITQTFMGTYSHRGVGGPGGIDFAASEGTPIRAAREGTIIFDGIGRGGINSGFGHYIIIDHHNGLLTLYAHLK